MNVVRFVIGGFFVFVVVGLISLFLIKLDLFFNGSWLMAAAPSWHWYNYLTSRHQFAMMYLQHNGSWLIPAGIFGLIGGLVCSAKKDD